MNIFDYKSYSSNPQYTHRRLIDKSSVILVSISSFIQRCSSQRFNMKFNAIAVTAILSATVSGVAIDNAAAARAAEITKAALGTTTEVEIALKGFEFYDEDEDREDLDESETEHLWAWSPQRRPIGLPVGKREAEVQPSSGWSPPYRSIGLPISRRDVEPEAKKEKKKKDPWAWSIFRRPLGLPAGKRDAQE